MTRSKISIIGGSICALIAALIIGINLCNFSFCLGLDQLSGIKGWPQMATLVSSDEKSPAVSFCNLPFFNLFAFVSPSEIAGEFYMKAYLYSLAGKDRLPQARICMAWGDKLTDKSTAAFVSAIHTINTRAMACEYLLHLPHLAEFCQRCAVAQCRRQADRAGRSKDIHTADYYLLLARQTNQLGEIFGRHQKFEIAERAYQDAIVSASIAAHLREDREPCDIDADPRPIFYFSYATYLSELDRQDQCFNVLDRLCRLR